jgi:hypothetical protein
MRNIFPYHLPSLKKGEAIREDISDCPLARKSFKSYFFTHRFAGRAE